MVPASPLFEMFPASSPPPRSASIEVGVTEQVISAVFSPEQPASAAIAIVTLS